MVHGLEDQPDVLEAGQVGGHHHEDGLGHLEDAEVDVVEPLVDVDQRVVVHRRELLGDERQVLGANEVGGLRRRRREQEVDPRIVLDHDLLDEVVVDRRRGDDVDDALAVEAQVEEDPVVAELEVARPPGQTLRPSSRCSAIAALMAMVVVPTPPFAP